MITLSGFHCTVLKKDIDTWKLLSQQIHIGLICRTFTNNFDTIEIIGQIYKQKSSQKGIFIDLMKMTLALMKCK
jgi:hypothetical protein